MTPKLFIAVILSILSFIVIFSLYPTFVSIADSLIAAFSGNKLAPQYTSMFNILASLFPIILTFTLLFFSVKVSLQFAGVKLGIPNFKSKNKNKVIDGHINKPLNKKHSKATYGLVKFISQYSFKKRIKKGAV